MDVQPHSHDSSTRRTVAAFVATGMAAVLVVAVLTGAWVRSTSRDEAIADARRDTISSAALWVTPALAKVTSAAPKDVRSAMDAAIPVSPDADRMLRRKLWASDGTIIWSDQPDLVGERFALDDDELLVLKGAPADAGISDLSAPENRFERGNGDVLEVYTGVRAGDGTRYLYEEYLRFSDVRADGRQILLHFIPGILAALLVLWLIQVPLALSLARRLDARRAERESLLRNAVASSDLERQRIARDLHDGVVQQITGTSLQLHAAAATTGDDQTSHILRTASADLRTALGGLRSLVVEIYPPNLSEIGISQALEDLMDTARTRGITVESDISITRTLSADEEALVFRVAQEAVRNVEKHARATTMHVKLESHDILQLVISDDGIGIPDTQAPHGHLGLQLVRDLVTASGGTLAVSRNAGEGTTLTMEIRGEHE